MTNDLVERLRALHVWPQIVADDHADLLTPRRIDKLYEVGRVSHEAADLIETQAREIERLREAFLETREMLGLAEQIICEECCPTTWKTADGQPHSPLHEDIRAVLFKHEATRDEARAALAGDSHDQ